ncbi:MAG: putative quinol monooxygenase [Porticoccaceae bacterium]
MAIGLIATMTIQEGKNAEFEQLFTELTGQVKANEPGTLFYALHRSKSDPQTYKVLEQYATKEDLKAHGQTDYFREANKKMAQLLGAPPEIEILDAV